MLFVRKHWQNVMFLWEYVSVKFLPKRPTEFKKKKSLEANFIFLKFQEVKLGAKNFNFLKIGCKTVVLSETLKLWFCSIYK